MRAPHPSPEKHLLPLAIQPSSPPKWTILQRHLFGCISKSRPPMKARRPVYWSSHRALPHEAMFCQWTWWESGLQSRLEKWTSSSFAIKMISRINPRKKINNTTTQTTRSSTAIHWDHHPHWIPCQHHLNLPTKLTIWTNSNSSNVILILQNDIYLPYESSNNEYRQQDHSNNALFNS